MHARVLRVQLGARLMIGSCASSGGMQSFFNRAEDAHRRRRGVDHALPLATSSERVAERSTSTARSSRACASCTSST